MKKNSKNIIQFFTELLGSVMTFGMVGLPFLGFALFAVMKTVGLLGGFVGLTNILGDFITGTPITFNGQEAKEGVIDPAFDKPDITMFHRVVPGIVARMQVAFLARINKITLKDDGCGTGITDKAIPPSEKFWTPFPLKVWLRQCAKNLETTFFTWGLKKGVQRKDLSATNFEDYVLEIMPDAIIDDCLRIMWFSDTAVSDNAGGGKLFDLAEVPNYNQLNGFWKKIFAAVTGGTTKRYTITENAGVSYVAQDALASDAAIKIFRGLLTGDTDPRLKGRKDKVIVCTTSIWENWLTYKETQSFDRSFERQEMGFETDVYRGVKIIAFDLWDRYIRADFNDGVVYYLPHRAILTIPDNLQIGFDDTNIDQLKVWYNEDTEMNNFKAGYMADNQIPYDFMIKAAF